MYWAENPSTGGIGYREEQTTTGTRLGSITKRDGCGVDYSRTISSGAASSSSVNTIDNLEDCLAEVGCEKVSSYGDGIGIDRCGVRLNAYVPSVERVNVRYLHLVCNSGSGSEGSLLGRVDVEKPSGMRSWDRRRYRG